jgi:hypothetical protein
MLRADVCRLVPAGELGVGDALEVVHPGVDLAVDLLDRPAIGSMRSQRTRLGANCFLASARSPALTASVNLAVSATRASTSATTQAL